MTAKITNGTIKVGRTIKTGDFENKRFDVELSFTIPEDGDAEVADYVSAVGELAMKQMNDMIGAKEAAPKPAAATKPPKVPKAEKPAEKAPEKSAADPSDMEELDRPTPPTPKFIEKEVAAANKKAEASEVDENDISSLMGGAEPAKEITDKELQDAAQKCMDKNKNAPAIHKVLRDLGIKSPPGRIIDLPQDKRQQYLDDLLKIKPLA